jgi:hypothetical protein
MLAAQHLDVRRLTALEFISWHRMHPAENLIAVKFWECLDADADLWVRRECVLEQEDDEVYFSSGDRPDEDTFDEVRGEALGMRTRVRFHDTRAETMAWIAGVNAALRGGL